MPPRTSGRRMRPVRPRRCAPGRAPPRFPRGDEDPFAVRRGRARRVAVEAVLDLERRREHGAPPPQRAGVGVVADEQPLERVGVARYDEDASPRDDRGRVPLARDVHPPADTLFGSPAQGHVPFLTRPVAAGTAPPRPRLGPDGRRGRDEEDDAHARQHGGSSSRCDDSARAGPHPGSAAGLAR